MPTYKTPDVYVEEISLFPPSVAEVETAIPAFIGYTEIATLVSTGDLLNTPTRIKSLLEFEALYGGAPGITLTEVILDDSNNFVSAAYTNSYYLYDSMRAFFDNGGGDCYVVAVGTYGDTVDRDELKAGLDAVKRVDEPTILLFPDAAGMSAEMLGAVQVHALMQCGALGDRVAVLDTVRSDSLGAAFRNNIGINNLKYGAAYTPWLKVAYDKNVDYEDVRSVIKKGSLSTTLGTLTSDSSITATINNLENALADRTLVANAVTALLAAATPAGSSSIGGHFDVVLNAYKTTRTNANMQAVFGYLYSLASLVDDLLNATTGVKNPGYRTTIENSVTNSLQPAFSTLIANEKELDAAVTGTYVPQWDVDPDPSATQWGNLFTSASPTASSIIPGSATTDVARTDALLASIGTNFTAIRVAIDAIVSAASEYVKIYEQSLYDTFPVYKNILTGIDNSLSEIPPSGAIAGIYALVDNQRGVWKAPANVSLANVIGPVESFDLSETDDLNVDVNAGKSINAIRYFSGKGTLVWGARTLAGNDNEWRYVSVRRFFNMVEESVKKSTYWAVFEPNDANTWVKVRGMIENYLIQKWREGALAGATTKDAFFVKCGLGTTMSAQDILEGRMNVEIGMAVVRPAEFIILKFSHKLQTS